VKRYKKFFVYFILYFAFVGIYGITAWDRFFSPSPNNHFVYLADSWLNGQLHMTRPPPHRNDWAFYKDKWYVSFPPFPALLMLPGVAILGYSFPDAAFTILIAALCPVLVFVLLNRMSQLNISKRNQKENLILTVLFGVGTVFYFSAVQGSVWYTAHMIGCALSTMYLIVSFNASRPFMAGLFLGLAGATRVPLFFLFPFFIYQVLRQSEVFEQGGGLLKKAVSALRWTKGGKRLFLFSVPVIFVGVVLMIHNYLRFGELFEFGHTYLQVIWQERIQRWGLFNYHYLARNLVAMFILLPWFMREAPYIQISAHGLSLFFTTPAYFYLLWPKQKDKFSLSLWLSVLFCLIPSLLYQNTGWVQFGYRFSLDYTVLLIMLLAIGGRKFGKLFFILLIFAILVNTFGAITFNRMEQFYNERFLLQPD
jgi:hypothetical protein